MLKLIEKRGLMMTITIRTILAMITKNSNSNDEDDNDYLRNAGGLT
jgi:hypothetical protein